jgi:hypothetical protein
MYMKRQGINSYSDKERRQVRRRNHFARDLAEPKFRQRVLDKHDKKMYNWEQDYEDWLKENDE